MRILPDHVAVEQQCGAAKEFEEIVGQFIEFIDCGLASLLDALGVVLPQGRADVLAARLPRQKDRRDDLIARGDPT
ncbi:hypothetical protein [Aurantimonas sp. VKM B-3413]|uniref:hypothetical protein n=1 Tax=Aurantimonas sp. VKM B-3413 TaxID=2779401 RepID=UPI001E656C2A|nr:hypothetical protein [Aurantimonas sp. VKM B-3413]